MPKMTQLSLFDTIDAALTCTECGVAFEAYEHNPHNLCLQCVDQLEALAVFRSDMSTARLNRLPDDCRGSYEAEVMGLPGTASRRLQTHGGGYTKVADEVE